MDKLISQRSRRPLVILLVLMLVSALFSATALAADYDGHWSQENIEAAQSRGWMVGYPDGTFRPDNPVTRAEFVVMLWRVLGEPQATQNHPFVDVGPDAWYRNAVAALYELGIVSGVGDDLFAPDMTLTREMGFAMLARAFGLEPNDPGAYVQFTDASSVSEWARRSLSALVERGYAGGMEDGSCAPQRPLTRAETAKLLIVIFDGERGSGAPEEPKPEEPKPEEPKPEEPKPEEPKPEEPKPEEPVPAKDETAPKITLSQSPTASTTGKVTITVDVDDESDIAFIGWRTSTSTGKYTTTSGFTNITKASEFSVSSNGWYAVCAKDEADNFSYELIQIKNISSGSSSGGSGSGGYYPGITYYAVTGVELSGEAVTGQTLTATVAPENATTPTYQWYVSNTNSNENGTAIADATGSTYVIKDGDAGKYIYVVASGYNNSSATSAQTAAVRLAVTFMNVEADGVAKEETTTTLTLTFNRDIEGITLDDITIGAGGTGAIKKADTILESLGGGKYALSLDGIKASGNITVSVAAIPGYAIYGSSKTVQIHMEAIAVAFKSAMADGGDGVSTTTKLTLTFDQDVVGFAVGDITITDTNETGATKGELTKTPDETGIYELTLTGIEKSGEITVSVAKKDYAFAPASIDVDVVFYEEPEEPVVTVTVTKAELVGFYHTVRIDGNEPTVAYDLYILDSTGVWRPIAYGNNAPDGIVNDYADGTKCIVVLHRDDNADIRDLIDIAFAPFGGKELENPDYTPPEGPGVYSDGIQLIDGR